jgi:predicted Zn-dependent protease
MEREADRVGYGVMTEAGYEPQGFVSMFEKLQQASRLNDNGSFPYLRSHPMTTERIADAQARQQLLPAKSAALTTPLHAMMAARAQVLADPGIDVLRSLAAQADAAAWATAPTGRQAGVLYAAVMAEQRQRNFAAAKRHVTRLQTLTASMPDARASHVVRLLAAELALAAGDTPTALRWPVSPDRASTLLLAQTRVATRQPSEAQRAADALRVWLSEHPRDASAWLLLVSAYEVQGDSLRAIRAQAEARAVELDYPAAVDRLKAAQTLAHSMAREGKLDRSGNIEASIVDARLRELEGLRREQALQR